VHFSALKHPIVGDTLYGAMEHLRVDPKDAAKSPAGNSASRSGKSSAKDEVTLPSLGRNFLHAAKLGFAQPRTGAWIDLRAPLPAELLVFLHQLVSAAGATSQRIDAALAGYL